MFDDVKFTTKADQIKFTTQTNGDLLVFTGIALTAEKAAALAYLVNQPDHLEIEIKKVGS